MPIQTGNEPPILCTTSQHSCLFRTATNHQYHAQYLNVHAYSDRLQTTAWTWRCCAQYWWFVAVLNRHERWDVVHSIGGLLPVWIGMNVEMLCTVTFMAIQTGNKPPILCTTSQRSCLFSTATNHQYRAQHLNVHAYSERQCCAQYWWFVAVLNRHERWDVVHSIGGLLPVWIAMNVEMLCTVLVVPPILCTTSQCSCLFRPATKHQYCA
jgi:hypothetical protein